MTWLIVIGVALLVLALIYAFPPIQICGDSMMPNFYDGDIVVGCRLLRKSVLGKVYIYTPPVGEHDIVIKRLTFINSTTGKLFFEGDNKDHSFDSRDYGYVTKDKIIARYLFTIYKKKGV